MKVRMPLAVGSALRQTGLGAKVGIPLGCLPCIVNIIISLASVRLRAADVPHVSADGVKELKKIFGENLSAYYSQARPRQGR